MSVPCQKIDPAQWPRSESFAFFSSLDQPFYSVSFRRYSYGLPELIGIFITAGLHLWKRNMLLSIAAGTITYMLLIRYVFV